MDNKNFDNKNEKNPSPKEVVAPAMPLPPPLPLPQLQRIPSLDSEPKTLLHGELNVAREAALEILNSHSREEALQIFLKGLQPVEIAKDIATEDFAELDSSSSDDEE